MVELLVEARIGLAEASEIENRQEQHSLEPNTANFRLYMLLYHFSIMLPPI